MASLSSAWKDIIFPCRCANCREIIPAGAICGKCYLAIDPYTFLRCGNCRARLPENKKVCHPDWPFLLGAASDYKNEPVQSLIKALKFSYITDAAGPLANLLHQFIKALPENIFENAILVPVPLHKKRLRERGFNQSELIAEKLSELAGLEMEKKILVRNKNTNPQSELHSPEERAENVAGCFEVTKPEKAAGRKIILVDDVITSGNTLLAASRALKLAGASKIYALAAAMA